MIADGKNVQSTIKKSLTRTIAESGRVHRLAIIYVGDDTVIERFIAMKQRFGGEIGVVADVFRFKDGALQENIIQEIIRLGSDERYGGIVVQLPLPAHIDVGTVLNVIPANKDIDVLSEKAKEQYRNGESVFIPPVAGAVEEILYAYDISLADKKIVVVGKGRLVGEPVGDWLKKEGYTPEIVDEYTENIPALLRGADIIVSGAGSPHMIKSDMIKNGAVLIDAGTSEQGGKLVGDIDISCAGNALLYTLVPGGVGPVTVAILFRNLVSARA